MSKTRSNEPTADEKSRARELQEQVKKLSNRHNDVVEVFLADKERIENETDPARKQKLAQELDIDGREARLKKQEKEIREMQAQIADLLHLKHRSSPTVGNIKSNK